VFSNVAVEFQDQDQHELEADDVINDCSFLIGGQRTISAPSLIDSQNLDELILV